MLDAMTPVRIGIGGKRPFIGGDKLLDGAVTDGVAAGAKQGWKEGDLVGVLLITRPLDRDIARTQSGLKIAFIMMGTAFVVVVGIAVVAAMRSRSRV